MSRATLPSEYRLHHASSLGNVAGRVLSQCTQAFVLGVTSRGLFLRSSSRWVTFLSYERFRSPLSVTLEDAPRRLTGVARGAVVQLQPGALLFPSVGIAVSYSEETVWQPPTPIGQPLPRVEQRRSLADVIRQAAPELAQRGFGPLLPHLLSPAQASAVRPEQQSHYQAIQALRQALAVQAAPAALEAAERLLGRGPGLTPSGDDFLLGLLLFLNRWPSMQAAAWLQPFGQAVTRAAYRCTTSISANLIECATGGDADERLLAMTDGVASGRLPANNWLPPLLTWGASSGIDALAGVAIALLL